METNKISIYTSSIHFPGNNLTEYSRYVVSEKLED